MSVGFGPATNLVKTTGRPAARKASRRRRCSGIVARASGTSSGAPARTKSFCMSTTTRAVESGASSNTVRLRDRVRERLEDVLREELELAKVGRHRVQQKVFDARVDARLDAPLNIVDRAGEVDRLDVVPRALVRDDGE